MSGGDEQERSAYPKSIQAGIPKINNPAGWPTPKIGALLKIVQRPVRLEKTKEYRLVTARRSRGGIVRRETLLGKDIATPSQFEIAEGDFLISRRQIAHGACGIVPAELAGSVVSNEYATLRPTAALDPGFLKHLTSSIYFQQTCFHSSIGVHVEKLVFDLQGWLRWPIAVPEPPEQRRIAAVLDTWDDAIATSSELFAAKRRRFLGILSDAIDPLLNGDRSVHSLFSNVGSGAWGEISETGLRILRNADFGLDGILSLEAAPVRQLSNRDLARTQLVLGDLVLEKSGGGPDQPVGRVSRFFGPEGYGYSNFLLRLTPNRENNAQFCYFILERMYQRRDPLYFQQQTTGIRNLEWRDYLDLPVTVPTFEEQSRIATILSDAELSVRQEGKILALLRAQKIGLMQKLLIGQLRVPGSIEALLPDHVQATA